MQGHPPEALGTHGVHLAGLLIENGDHLQRAPRQSEQGLNTIRYAYLKHADGTLLTCCG